MLGFVWFLFKRVELDLQIRRALLNLSRYQNVALTRRMYEFRAFQNLAWLFLLM